MTIHLNFTDILAGFGVAVIIAVILYFVIGFIIFFKYFS